MSHAQDPSIVTDRPVVTAGPQPTPAQQAWMGLEFGLFVHFGVNTFNDCEWSDGSLPAGSFAPSGLDAAGWVAVAKAAGMRYVVLVAKHHDGFCLWDTDASGYGVRQSPWRGDVIAQVAQACRDAGLALGLYYSLWDRHAACYPDDRAYATYMQRHLAELLTRYGPICELWFDGGWKKGGVDRQDDAAWHWRACYDLIHAIQPDCLVADNATTTYPGRWGMWPVDFRIGEKTVPTDDDRQIWWTGNGGSFLPYEAAFTLSAGTGKGMFGDGKWFWHEDDRLCQSPAWVRETLSRCRARGANLVLNVGPGPDGRLRDVDRSCLEQILALV